MVDVDHLYALPLEEFIAARGAAAKEIRKAGDRETAAIVAKLPKPTPAAWTANQVAREQPELVEAMLEAGAAMREAQEAAISGGGGQGLREATLAERAAVDAVMAAAITHRPAGRALSSAVADRLRTTLHAAASDEAIREALAAGRLVSEAQAGGAWPFALEPSEPAEPKPRAKAKPAAAAETTRGKPKRAASGGAAAKRAAAKDHAEAEASGASTGAKRAAAKRAAAKDDAEVAAAREAAEREAAAERAERERAKAERKALEAQLRDARGSLRVRERGVTSAAADVKRAESEKARAMKALAAAQRTADDAQAETEAAERVRAEAKAALSEARDDVGRIEERLD